MIEITIYGRGGQGGVTLAKLIAAAWFAKGKYTQAFGVYAAERSGAPIQAYVRIDDAEITNHNQIREPDHVIVLDPTLIGPGILTGLKRDGAIILNTPRATAELAAMFAGHTVWTIDATSIAVENGLGTRAVPIVNTTMMGAVARSSGLTFDEVTATFDDLGFGSANLVAAKEAFETSSSAVVPGGLRESRPEPGTTPAVSLLDPNTGAPPQIRTGSWATRRPERRTLTPPCNSSCPAGNDVQRFVQAASRAAYDEALAVLLETSPLPGICGRVCPAPCMAACNRNEFDEGVNVRELERFVSDHGEWPNPVLQAVHERIAVVGSGPAGLSAAYQLAKLGYHVSLFEAGDQLGGVLRNGIPEYRLPREVLDRELGFILMHGVTAYTDARIDRAALRELTRHYSAVFVATGLQESRSLDLGESREAVRQGIDFLEGVHRGEENVSGMRVVVVGGGNTAIDAARSARRLGASDVHILYRRSRAEMPAIAEEIEAAIEEGIVLDELALPVHTSSEGKTVALTCVRMVLGDPDPSGRRQPVRATGPAAEFVVRCDRVILALGQSADISILPEGNEIHENGKVVGVTGAPVFIGGDLGKSEGTVAAAIGSGRRAALHIHCTLTGHDLIDRDEAQVATADLIRTRTFPHAARTRGGTISHELREHTFAEVHTGLTDAAVEAQRCFSCGVCNSCDRCLTYCPEGVLTTDGDTYTFNFDFCKGCGVCAAECPRGVILMSQI
ncbi:MAG TPA: FAD-dependent oxidoreductase [Thermoanaerobaculia bacterium]|nr:FAD-dependent oxidoreductase [Thermoanaerobaculia bacterium]